MSAIRRFCRATKLGSLLITTTALLCCLTSPLAAAEPIRLQLRWLHQFQFAGYYMAKEKGFYREAGLDVDIVEGGPNAPKAIDSMLSGESDFAVANSGLVIAHMQGKPVVALAAIMQSSPSAWIVLADSNIFTPLDLADKRLMLLPLPESAELRLTLLREGISLNNLNITNASFNPQDLIDHKIDAYDGYSTNEPFWLEQQGVPYRLIRPREYGVNFYNDILTTRTALIEQRPEMVDAFVRASLQGWQYALDHIEETIAVIHAQYAPNKSLEHLRFEAEAIRELVMPELVQIGHMNPGRWKTIAASYKELGMADGPLDLEQFIYHHKEPADYSRLYALLAASLLVLLLVGAFALRLTRLTGRLRREVSARIEVEHELLKTNQQLEKLANTDRLTGLWNRLKLEEVANIEIRRAERYDFALSLLFFDIDHFKAINDQYAHEVGDQTLACLSELLQQHLREADSLCRWGGEEFLLLMPHTDLSQASSMAEKLRSLIANTPITPEVSFTASFGVAQWQKGQNLDELIQQADQRLYRAKALGRNRVEAGNVTVVASTQ